MWLLVTLYPMDSPVPSFATRCRAVVLYFADRATCGRIYSAAADRPWPPRYCARSVDKCVKGTQCRQSNGYKFWHKHCPINGNLSDCTSYQFGRPVYIRQASIQPSCNRATASLSTISRLLWRPERARSSRVDHQRDASA